MTSDPRAAHSDKHLAIADAANRDFVPGLKSGLAHHLDRERDLVLRRDPRNSFTLARLLVKDGSSAFVREEARDRSAFVGSAL